MNIHNANAMIKYLKTRKTQPYKMVSMCNDTELGCGCKSTTQGRVKCWNVIRVTTKH